MMISVRPILALPLLLGALNAADAAAPVACPIDGSVLWSERVPPLAMRCVAVHSRGAADTAFRRGISHVVHLCADEQMLRVHATGVVAVVTDEHAVRDGADEKLVGQPMRECRAFPLTSHSHAATRATYQQETVAPIVRPDPLPASIGIGRQAYVLTKPLDRCAGVCPGRGLMHGAHSRTIPQEPGLA